MKIEDFNFAGHKAIVRVDFNVPLDENGNVTDDTRIRGALPTLKKVLADGGALIMMSHMGKPKGKVKPELSLSQIVKNVSDALGVDVKFAKDCGNADAEAAALKPGEALLLENLRFYPEEEGKPVGVEKGTPEFDAAKAEMKERQKKFAAKLASYADVYVMDAFGTAHRKHASTAVIADSFDKDHKMLGFLMEKEVKAVDAVLGNIKRPFTAIMGGSKVSERLGVEVKFANDCANASEATAALKPGEALLLENLRFYPEEEGKPVGVEKGTPEYDEAKKAMKESQKEFAKKLASYADVYVMDAFGTAHRKHASTAVIADYFDKDHKMLGYLMEKEVKAVDAVLGNIKRPFTAIMGGSKVSTKIGIIENLLTKVDNLILCGGMTYTFSKALGGKIGMSICEDDKLDVALDVIKKAKENGVNLVLGTDSICGDDFKNDCNTQVCPSNNIPDGWEGMDAGPETRKAFAAAIKGAKTILWNGPAGVFEFDNFAGGSKAIADAIAEATKEGAFSLIGGGDSVACINKFGLADQVSYISTGGGALLEAIEGKVLPGVAAIEK